MIWDGRRKLLGEVFLNLKEKKGNLAEILRTSDFPVLIYREGRMLLYLLLI